MKRLERGERITGSPRRAASSSEPLPPRRPRKTVHVDEAGKARNLKRLRRIEGQVRGIAQMVADDRWCADVLTQLTAVQAALKSVGLELVRHHMKCCVPAAVREGREGEVIDEIVDLLARADAR
jgi:DNA-binding FrmR family transcriptional regulator